MLSNTDQRETEEARRDNKLGEGNSREKINYGAYPLNSRQTSDLTLRPGPKLQECSVAGCDEPPTELLPLKFQLTARRPFCKPHAELIIRLVEKRNYQSFLEWMRQQGIEGESTLATGYVDVREAKCGIPGCSDDGHGLMFS